MSATEQHEPLVDRLVEWAQWRGRVDGEMSGLTAAIGELSKGMHARLGDIDRNLNRRLDDQDRKLDETVRLQRLTNGRVTDLEEERAGDRAVAHDRAKRKGLRDRRRQFALRAALSLTGVGLGAAATELVAKLHL